MSLGKLSLGTLSRFLGNQLSNVENCQEVKLVRWPAERGKRDEFRKLGVLRLLVVEGGADAPICTDVREDWIRAPITHNDLRARMATLRAKTMAHGLPRVDRGGVMRFGSKSVAVSPTEAELLELLTNNFGAVVSRDALRNQLSAAARPASRNALDLHIMRIRRRIADLGLVIHTAWGSGYVLTNRSDSAEAPAGAAVRQSV